MFKILKKIFKKIHKFWIIEIKQLRKRHFVVYE